MASFKARISQAAALHRQAAAVAAAAGLVLDAARPAAADQLEQNELAARLRSVAAHLAPGWLGAPLDAQSPDTPLGGPASPAFVRVGTAQLLDDARFPVIVPLLGTGHLTVEADIRDRRVAGLLRSLLLRLLAGTPAGSLLVRTVDTAGAGLLFGPFAPLIPAGLMSPPATDHAGLRATLAEAERWIGARSRHRARTMLLVIASLPELTEGADLDRIAALAEHGPAAGLHLVVAGWPPPPLTPETTRPQLPHSTPIRLRNPYALVGDPPGTRFGNPAPERAANGLNAPVFLDEDPPPRLVDQACRMLAAQRMVGERPSLTELLPAPPAPDAALWWNENPADGLVTMVGYDDDTPVTLRLDDLTPNWMAAGRSDAGRREFLANVLYGLCTRYRASDLVIYLLDCGGEGAFEEFAPRENEPRENAPGENDGWWLPQVRTVGLETDRDYGLAVLGELDGELTRRIAWYEQAGVSRFTELSGEFTLPRILCVIDQFPVLLARKGPTTPVAELMERLARKGRSYGIHLLLSSDSTTGPERPYPGREPLFHQFPVRIALPGGAAVLEADNDAAVCLPVGTAVVNTAGGLGGPRGATRGHERTVRFPDPYADPGTLAAIRSRFQHTHADDPRPAVYVASARRRIDDDPVFRAALARPSTRPAALLGRVIDVPVSVADFPIDTSPGRHLAVVGPSPAGADLLDAVARSLAAQHAPRSTRFVVAPLAPGCGTWAAELAEELVVRQEVEVVDAEGLVKAMGTERPGYLVVYGMDAVASHGPPLDQVHELLREGPRRGVHLVSWWREPAAFAAVASAVDGLVLLDVAATEVSELLGEPVDWQPRAGRALLHDRRTRRTALIAPFVRADA